MAKEDDEPRTTPIQTTRRSEPMTTAKHPAFGDSPTSLMLGEFRVYLEGVKKDVHDSLAKSQRETHEDIKGLHEKIKDNADRSLQAHEATRKHVARLTTMVRSLWTKVYGSDPPPPPPRDEDLSFALTEPDAKTDHEVPMDEQISEHDLTLQGIEGRLIAVSAATNKVDQRVGGVEVQVGTLLELQKEQMGKRDPDDGRRLLRRMVDGIAWMIRERDGQRFALSLIAAFTGFVTAIGTTYALVTGRLPLPHP